jgi:3-deoxy-D-manno-octulosonic-acid transferase
MAAEDAHREEEEALMAVPPPDRIVWKTSPEAREVPEAPEGASGPLLFLLFRLVGLLALPFLLLHPRARRHIVGLAAPDPGFVWIHGASAGEHVAAKALARVIGPEIFRTSSSWRTPAVGAFPAPLDLPFVIEPWLDRARPCMLVLVEAELWPGWIKGCERRGIPVVVVNARLGRGTERLRRLRTAWHWLTRSMQFVPQAETGDLKLSAEIRDATFALGRAAFVAGSTREGTGSVLAAWRTLPEPRPLLVLAPRHLARVPEVERLLVGEKWRRRTRTFGGDTDVLLLDTMGELGGLYRQARAAFIEWHIRRGAGRAVPRRGAASRASRDPWAVRALEPAAWSAGIVLTGDLANAMRTALRLGPQVPVTDASAERAASMLPERAHPAAHRGAPWLLPIARMLVRDRPPARVERAPIRSCRSDRSWRAARAKRPSRAGSQRGSTARGSSVAVPARRVGDVRTSGDLGDELEMLGRAGLNVIVLARSAQACARPHRAARASRSSTTDSSIASSIAISTSCASTRGGPTGAVRSRRARRVSRGRHSSAPTGSG